MVCFPHQTSHLLSEDMEDPSEAPVKPMHSSGRYSGSMRGCACRGIFGGDFIAAVHVGGFSGGQTRFGGGLGVRSVPRSASCHGGMAAGRREAGRGGSAEVTYQPVGL